jgi:signal peptidase I
MRLFFRKLWQKFINFNKVQKTLIFSLLASIVVLLFSTFSSQGFYDKNIGLIISLLLIFWSIAGVSLIILLGRFLSTRIRGSEKLKKMGLMNSKTLFIYSLVTLFVSLGVMLLGLTKNSTILAVLLFSLTALSALICGLIFIKFLFHFKLVRGLLTFSIIGLVVLFFVYLLIVRPQRIYGNSMMPGLTDGSYLLTAKVPYYLSNPKRGDIIVFTPPINSSDVFIDRIVGLPRETISVKQGDVYINSQILVEKYLLSPKSTKAGAFLEEDKSYKIPEGSYFVMSDDREITNDSRVWGPVNKSAISGKAWIRHWPLKEFGTPVK